MSRVRYALVEFFFLRGKPMRGVVLFVAGAGLLISGSRTLAVDAVRLAKEVAAEAADVSYQISIQGTILTPSPEGALKFPLKSRGEFHFVSQTHPFPDGSVTGLAGLRASRRFSTAETVTTVGEDLTTSVSLSPVFRTIHVVGGETALLQWSPRAPLSRKQLDLLQMPFDPLAVAALLPDSPVMPGEKWNTEPWLAPLLTGIDTAVKQECTCELVSVMDNVAVVSIIGSLEGAVQGSASEVSFEGTLRINRETHLIGSLQMTQKEKRSAGPVTPGLEITAEIQWQQTPADSSAAAGTQQPPDVPGPDQLALTTITPARVELQHGREWHLFHETATVLMMRQLRSGKVISQCNVSQAVTVPPGQHTLDAEFLQDVTKAVAEQKGRVVSEATIREDRDWRIRHVRAVGGEGKSEIFWDYYLCTAATGEQASILFSHAAADNVAFGDEAVRILKSLRLVRGRTTLPF
ncbi:MAG: hypothetical protein R3C49_21495 [Planctomycetaceae bacterium]